MKKNYDIRMNPRRPSSQEVARHKDFDALLKKYNAAPRPKTLIRRLVYIGGAIAAAIAGLVLLSQIFGFEKGYEQRAEAYFASQTYVNPPVDNVKPQFTSFQVGVNQGGVYEYPSGSKLIVPPAAFTGEDGKPVEGEVTIHYREMHDFVDFFLSGIPMTYDSAGVKYTLESAGMIEVFAEQNGKRVNMAPGKSIDVELVSRVNVPPTLDVPPGYNIYQLDSAKRNWVYQDIDRMTVLGDVAGEETLNENDPLYTVKKDLRERMQAITVTRENELARIESSIPKPQEPVKPQRANGTDHVFDLDFSDLYPATDVSDNDQTKEELKALYRQYENMLWQLSPQSDISPKQLQKEFSQVSDISLRKLNNRDFEITLKKENQSVSIIANPVLSGSDYDNAMAGFNKEFEVYQKQIEERESRLKAEREALERKIAEQKKLAQIAYEERLTKLRNQGLYAEATDEVIKQKVVNRFRATGFGIWNCDRPLPPMMAQVKASFRDRNGAVYHKVTGYIVDKNYNTVTRFLATEGTKLSFNRNSQNLLWLVTDDNKIAVFRPQDFKKIEKGQDEYTFVLEKVDKEIRDEKDVREILYL